MKKYLYLFSIFLFTNSLSSYNLNLPEENTTWREFLFVKSREKKNPSFLQTGIGSNQYNKGCNIFLLFQQDLNKFYAKLFFPFYKFKYYYHSEAGSVLFLDDIGVICGYKLVKSKTADFSLNLGGTIPTSSGFVQKGDIGFGIDFSKKAWKNRLRFDVIANYRYLFGYSGIYQKINSRFLFDVLFNFSFNVRKIIFDFGWDYYNVSKERPSYINWRHINWTRINLAHSWMDSKSEIDPKEFERLPRLIHTFSVGLGGIIKQVMLGVGLNYSFNMVYEGFESSGFYAKVGFVF